MHLDQHADQVLHGDALLFHRLNRDPINVSVYGKHQPLAQKIYDRAGWR